MSVFDKPVVKRTLGERVARAEQAMRLLESPMLIEARDSAEHKILLAWRDGKTPEERERAWAARGSLDLLQRELKIIVQDGEHARVSMEREK